MRLLTTSKGYLETHFKMELLNFVLCEKLGLQQRKNSFYVYIKSRTVVLFIVQNIFNFGVDQLDYQNYVNSAAVVQKRPQGLFFAPVSLI